MTTILFPFTIADGDPESAGPVMANFQAISSVVNGSLEAGTNVLAAPPSAQTGASISGGSSASVARADHQHSIRGFEQLTADPTSSNFVGRIYLNTSTGKLRYCTNISGSGTYITIANQSASEVPLHGTNHVGSGTDALNPPMCLAARSSNLSIASSTITAVNFTATDIYDTDTMHDTVTNATRITCTHAGVYRFSANVMWALNGTGNRQAQIILSTGPTIAHSSSDNPPAGQNPAHSLSGTYLMAANDYAEVYVFQNSGGALSIIGTGANDQQSKPLACYFGAEWIGTGA